MVFLQHCLNSEQHCFLLEQIVFNALQKFQTDWVEFSTQFSLVIKNSCYLDYPAFCQYILDPQCPNFSFPHNFTKTYSSTLQRCFQFTSARYLQRANKYLGLCKNALELIMSMTAGT